MFLAYERNKLEIEFDVKAEENIMEMKDKQMIAATARQLIWMLETCDDEEFVDMVLDCVASADSLSLDPEEL